MNKLSVNIYDKEYTIAGDHSTEQIAKMAAHVDKVMREVSEASSGKPVSAIAVLGAMSVAEELFAAEDRNEELGRLNKQFEADTQHYVQLWEESKKNYAEFKADSQKEIEKLQLANEALREKLHDKTHEVETVMQSQKDIEAAAMEDSQEIVKQMEKKYNDLENNYFDLQMENIQLKSELEKLKNNFKWKKDEHQGF